MESPLSPRPGCQKCPNQTRFQQQRGSALVTLFKFALFHTSGLHKTHRLALNIRDVVTKFGHLVLQELGLGDRYRVWRVSVAYNW